MGKNDNDCALISQNGEEIRLDHNPLDNKISPPLSNVYKEFAAQQRLIQFEHIHQDGKERPPGEAKTRGAVKKISTNLSLNGYNIRFDMFSPGNQTSSNVVCEKASTIVTVV